MAIAVIGMVGYLLIGWWQLALQVRRDGMFTLIGWMVLFYGVVHANGLSISGLLH
ncbi:MAG: hypothetical protein U9N81_06860 [Bacillota bacterium]|nr:hypothetical protein [Bacillota bacterium]